MTDAQKMLELATELLGAKGPCRCAVEERTSYPECNKFCVDQRNDIANALIAAASTPLPGTEMREAIAKIINPYAFSGEPEELTDMWPKARCDALAKADAILALSPAGQTGTASSFDKNVEAERQRCLAICEGWIGTYQDREIQYTSAREYAIDAIEDIMDLIRDGHQPSHSRPESK